MSNDDNVDDNDNNSLIRKETECFNYLLGVFNKNNDTDIKLLGKGTYSYVYAVCTKKTDTNPGHYSIVKVCREKKSFNPAYIGIHSFFCPALFREIFLTGVLKHPNIYTFDTTVYDKSFGIYRTGKIMRSDLTCDEFVDQFNVKIFFRLLEDMNAAFKHMHSYGLIHSDIKPANILYNLSDRGEYSFKLCDFNITQFYGANDLKMFNVYATRYFSEPTNTIRTMMVDTFMLGASIIYITSRSFQKEKWSQIDIKRLESKRDEIVARLDLFCYNILYLMITDTKHRIYVDHIDKIIKAYKKNGYSTDKLEISEIFNTPNGFKNNNIVVMLTYEDHLVRNENILLELSHKRVMDTINNSSPEGIKMLRYTHCLTELNEYDLELEKKHSSIKTLYWRLLIILRTRYNLRKDIASFFAESISYFPKDRKIQELFKSKDVVEINNAAVMLCTSNIYVDLHLLSCIQCQRELLKRCNSDITTD